MGKHVFDLVSSGFARVTSNTAAYRDSPRAGDVQLVSPPHINEKPQAGKPGSLIAISRGFAQHAFCVLFPRRTRKITTLDLGDIPSGLQG